MASSRAALVQKAPRTFFIGLNMRDMRMPMVKGQSMRSDPPSMLVRSTVHPTPMEPYPDWSVTANHVRAQQSAKEKYGEQTCGQTSYE